MQKSKVGLVVVVVFIMGSLILTHIPAMAHGKGGESAKGGMMGPGPSSPEHWAPITSALRHKEELGLNEEQVKSLKALKADYEKGAAQKAADLRKAERELGELLTKDPMDMGQVEAKVKAIEGLRSEIRLDRIRTIEKGKAILTKEQWQKLVSLMKARKKRPVVKGG
ncbi:MAG: periplasmic heavy metal sensor [candidate division NC10 bacterium]|nr:periplasmic heavy metal sensor [candidate division NC10 bacterium]